MIDDKSAFKIRAVKQFMEANNFLVHAGLMSKETFRQTMMHSKKIKPMFPIYARLEQQDGIVTLSSEPIEITYKEFVAIAWELLEREAKDKQTPLHAVN
jgi:hypothetical protein